MDDVTATTYCRRSVWLWQRKRERQWSKHHFPPSPFRCVPPPPPPPPPPLLRPPLVLLWFPPTQISLEKAGFQLFKIKCGYRGLVTCTDHLRTPIFYLHNQHSLSKRGCGDGWEGMEGLKGCKGDEADVTAPPPPTPFINRLRVQREGCEFSCSLRGSSPEAWFGEQQF